MITATKETIVFKQKVNPGAQVELFERVKGPGTVEEVRVRFYPGPEGALQVIPFVMHKAQRIEQLVTYVKGGDAFLSGDDDREIYPTIITVEENDKIYVRATNTSTLYVYTINVVVVIDYYAGTDRIVGGVIRG